MNLNERLTHLGRIRPSSLEFSSEYNQFAADRGERSRGATLSKFIPRASRSGWNDFDNAAIWLIAINNARIYSASSREEIWVALFMPI